MHVPLDLQPVLEQYRPAGLPPLEPAEGVHRGFSGATVYRLTTPQGDFALRNWGPRCPPLRRLWGLHRLLDWIDGNGVRTVAVPLAAHDGATTVVRDGTVWQLEPWMSGAADFHANPSRARLGNVMRALAEWHSAARRFQPADDEREWFRSEPAECSPAVRERLQRILKWRRGRLRRLQQVLHADPGELKNPRDLNRLGRFIIERFETASPTVAAELQAAADWRVELQPCLRDVWHDHVLFSADEVTGLIDPSACRCENVASDLARVLGSLVGDDRPAWEFALECYGRHREWRPAELRLLPILDRSAVLLSGLTWLDRYYLQPRPIPEQRAVVARLEQITERLGRLTGSRELPQTQSSQSVVTNFVSDVHPRRSF